MSLTVTVLITVYNEESLIASAVSSALNQRFADFEVLVVDDGSTDRTADVLSLCHDARLRVLRPGRLGRAAALALGVEEARGTFVAILDADDAAYPERLAKQVAFMEAHPEVAWLGCAAERDDSRGERRQRSVRIYPVEDSAIRRMAARCVPYPHSGVMFRRSLIDEGLNYDRAVSYLIDFELFLRVAERYRVANLSDVLIMRRLRDASFFESQFKRREQNRALARLSASAVRRLRLPSWHLVFPLARLGYDLVPRAFRPGLRRIAGLKEA